MSERHDDLLEPIESSVDEEAIEDNEGIPDNAVPPVHYQITSYGADYPVDGLVTRIQDGSIYVPTFQRGYVWGINLASRFIESLLLGLPVPGIFLSRDEDTQKLLVIDGQRRLRTLQYFFEGVFPPLGQQFTLRKVQAPFQGATYGSLSDEQRRALNDAILHATIVRQDLPTEDYSSIYQIFERLNTGGIRLSPQEIRTCLYHGELADLLRDLNETEAWRRIFGRLNRRMRDQEMILRFLALYYRAPYEEYIAEFLNKYMGSNRHLQLQSKEEIVEAFVPTIELTDRAVAQMRSDREAFSMLPSLTQLWLALRRGFVVARLRTRRASLTRQRNFSPARTSRKLRKPGQLTWRVSRPDSDLPKKCSGLCRERRSTPVSVATRRTIRPW